MHQATRSNSRPYAPASAIPAGRRDDLSDRAVMPPPTHLALDRRYDRAGQGAAGRSDARDRTGQGLSRLLNAVDGLIGPTLRILVS